MWFTSVADMPLKRLKNVLTSVEPGAYSEANLKAIVPRGRWKDAQAELIRLLRPSTRPISCPIESLRLTSRQYLSLSEFSRSLSISQSLSLYIYIYIPIFI